MEIKIIQATLAHLTACKDALLNSEVGKLYFTDERAATFLREGIEKGEIYVAIGDGNWEGSRGYVDHEGCVNHEGCVDHVSYVDHDHYVRQPEQVSCLGYIWFSLRGTFYAFPYVRNLMVKEEYRSLGVGKTLLDYFEQIAFASSCKVFLLVNEENQRAKQFYERNGYKEVGYIPDLIREGLSEFLMMKSRQQ